MKKLLGIVVLGLLLSGCSENSKEEKYFANCVKDGKKFGKWILRETFEIYLPNNITLRKKSPMQDGSGTNNLTGLFNTKITDDMHDLICETKDECLVNSNEFLVLLEKWKLESNENNSVYKSPFNC